MQAMSAPIHMHALLNEIKINNYVARPTHRHTCAKLGSAEVCFPSSSALQVPSDPVSFAETTSTLKFSYRWGGFNKDLLRIQ
jgi:hypothetical protein